MNRNKHLTLEDRQIIAASLNENNSFKTIGMVLHKDCTTIAKRSKAELYGRKKRMFRTWLQ